MKMMLRWFRAIKEELALYCEIMSPGYQSECSKRGCDPNDAFCALSHEIDADGNPTTYRRLRDASDTAGAHHDVASGLDDDD